MFYDAAYIGDLRRKSLLCLGLFLLFLLFWQRYAKINPCLNSINGDEEEENARGGSAERDLLVREFPAVMRKVASELSG